MFDNLQRYLVIERCWKIYNLVTETFDVESSFHVDYPVTVENALLTGRLLVRVASLFIQEEYRVEAKRLVITNYSYILMDERNQPLIRADSAPHHQTDYRGKSLSNFPHHLHDEQGQICDFSGRIEDFLELSLEFIRKK